MNQAKAIRSEDASAGIRRAARLETEIEVILAGEEELLPSSGFVASVMDQVRQEAELPAPIPFPWKRAAAGILLATGVLGWGAVELVRLGLPALSSLAISPPPLSADLVRASEQAGWVALALGSSLVCWLVSRRLAGRGGLL
jgi:hypothetical protein